MNVAVLDASVLLFVADGPLSQDAAFRLRRAIKEALPGWKAVVVDGPGRILDLRGNPDSKALAKILASQIDAHLAEAAS